MALNPNPVGTLVGDYFVSHAPAPGTPITESQIEALWQGAMNLIYSDIKSNADVVAAAHSGESLSAPGGQALSVTTGPGAGSTGATTADVPVAGKGSIL